MCVHILQAINSDSMIEDEAGSQKRRRKEWSENERCPRVYTIYVLLRRLW